MSTWADNTIQFPRLIAEAQMAGAFTIEVVRDMATSMDLEISEVAEVIDRACDLWDLIVEGG